MTAGVGGSMAGKGVSSCPHMVQRAPVVKEIMATGLG